MKRGQKNIFNLLLVFAFLIISLTSLIQAEDLVCCEETRSGDFCQYVPSTECVSQNADATSCDSTTYCQRGTCIDDDGGTCTAGVRRATCENTPSGSWQPQDIDELYSCQKGCCLVGDNAEFVTQIECTQIATDFGVDVRFESSITDEFTCLDLSNSEAKGACVINEGGRRGCTIETKMRCSSSGGSFHEGILCTADYLETDCVKTANTVCGPEDKVYFQDSCNNLANVYDSRMFTTKDSEWTQVMEDYWTTMQDPSCSRETTNGNLNVDCGDCHRIPPVGTMCREVENSNKPEFGDYTCQSLNCLYNGEIYRNGEKWCADSPGILDEPILIDDPRDPRKINDEIRDKLVNGVNEYNLPGSQYTLLTCWDGEIIAEPCATYRNEYCVQSSINTLIETEFKTAWCAENRWRECVLMDNKEDCEDLEKDCKWMPGYSFFLDEETGAPQNLRTPEDMKENSQGSCVPLIAPGFDFWLEDTQATQVCSMGAVKEEILYEEWWGRSTANADERFYDGSNGDYWAEQRCYDNCYAIPEYGDSLGASTVEKIHEGSSSVTNTVSNRLGYYCMNSDELPSKGQASGSVACAGDPDDDGWYDIRSRREYPLFFTNEDWVDFLTTRTRSLGDCGYKTNSIGEESDPELEIIKALFQKLEGKEEEAKNVTEERIIFKGNEYLEEAEEVF